jgi:hypothetical protein
LQLRRHRARQQQRHHGCAGCQRREANSSRYCIERSSSFSLSVLASSAESTSQLWVRTPAGEVWVHDSLWCLHYDSTTLEKGLSRMSQVQSQHQRWYTLRTGQLQLRGTDLCLRLMDSQSTQSDTIAVPCSTTPFLTIAFGQPSIELYFRLLGFDSTTAVLQPSIYNFSTLNPDTGLVYLFGEFDLRYNKQNTCCETRKKSFIRIVF